MKTIDRHVIAGTFNQTRHQERLRNERHIAQIVNKTRPILPSGIKGRAKKLWETLLSTATWLTELDTMPLAQYVCLAAEWEREPDRFPAARYAAMRKIESDLGLTVMHRGKVSAPEEPAAGSNFFDD
jgi:hypothetical protein